MRKTFLFICILLMLTACQREQAYEPEEINPDIDVCMICNMSITAENYATEAILKDGTVHKFDDIGCMFEFMKQEDKENIAKLYVRDIETSEWIELEKAFFAYDRDYWTPMNYGVVSFASEENAKKYIEKEGKGQLWTYDQLLQHKWGFEQ
ncbi:nitrous oxide reductase accessory protein NosL [Thermolongibacillus altinsuensis]|uniref:nitrous oxide reductase accessory protein NosL n=1 Tax=Thermolongibacillus altinsuensis TaxID=575256 RepID=UPI00242A2B49|nr:nitrous oxide reductase accessory protein NosL [Thermolongibacillus altinsuensis]GMB08275.1 hypothetical protein B1no1_09850 [Thermolongibacillus altinsuensis]